MPSDIPLLNILRYFVLFGILFYRLRITLYNILRANLPNPLILCYFLYKFRLNFTNF